MCLRDLIFLLQGKLDWPKILRLKIPNDEYNRLIFAHSVSFS